MSEHIRPHVLRVVQSAANMNIWGFAKVTETRFIYFRGGIQVASQVNQELELMRTALQMSGLEALDFATHQNRGFAIAFDVGTRNPEVMKQQLLAVRETLDRTNAEQTYQDESLQEVLYATGAEERPS